MFDNSNDTWTWECLFHKPVWIQVCSPIYAIAKILHAACAAWLHDSTCEQPAALFAKNHLERVHILPGRNGTSSTSKVPNYSSTGYVTFQQGCLCCPLVVTLLRPYPTRRCHRWHRLLHAPFSMLEFGSSCFRTFLASDGLRQPKDHGIFCPLSHAVNWARYRYRLVKEPLEYQPLWTNLRWLMVWNANPGSSTNSTSQPRSHSITSYFSYANLSELGDKNSISASYEVHKLKTRCQDVKHGLINSSRLN